MASKRIKLGVLGSGRGSNFIAIQNSILNNAIDAEIAVVISNKKSKMLEKASEYGLESVYVNPKDSDNKESYDLKLVQILKEHDIDIVILAGYMKILTNGFIEAFPGRIMNIHPSLLPSFRGLHPQQQALDSGVKFSGCTVHLVIPELDAGPILSQHVVPVLAGDDEDALSARILVEEHKLYSGTIQSFIKNKL